MILGITGGTGCGKTTLLRELRARGGEVLDCDEIYHALLQTDAALLAASKESGTGEARLLVCKAIYQSQLTIAVALAPEAKNTVADPEKDTEKE